MLYPHFLLSHITVDNISLAARLYLLSICMHIYFNFSFLTKCGCIHKVSTNIWFLRKWSTTKPHFEVRLNITLKINNIRCKKLVTIVSGRKKCGTIFRHAKKVKHEYRNVATTYVARTFRHSCLLIFTWWRVELHFFNPKHLLKKYPVLDWPNTVAF